MPLSSSFNSSANDLIEAAPKPRKKKAAPFSIRLSPADRIRLTKEAGEMPLGTYVRAKVLSTAPLNGIEEVADDRKMMARILARLGGSNLANNLRELALAVNSGSLLVTPEVESALLTAVQDIREIRGLLVAALSARSGSTR